MKNKLTKKQALEQIRTDFDDFEAKYVDLLQLSKKSRQNPSKHELGVSEKEEQVR